MLEPRTDLRSAAELERSLRRAGILRWIAFAVLWAGFLLWVAPEIEPRIEPEFGWPGDDDRALAVRGTAESLVSPESRGEPFPWHLADLAGKSIMLVGLCAFLWFLWRIERLEDAWARTHTLARMDGSRDPIVRVLGE